MGTNIKDTRTAFTCGTIQAKMKSMQSFEELVLTYQTHGKHPRRM